MTREEAIKEAYGIPVTKAQHEALQFLIPELNESEDERIRNEILLYIGSKQDIDLDTHNRWCAYLENQKELSELGKYIAAERTKPGFMFEGNDSVSWEELPFGVRKHDYPYYFMGDLDCYPFNVEKQIEDYSSFSDEQREYMRKYMFMDKVTLVKLLAERDRNAEEILGSFENKEKQKSNIEKLREISTPADEDWFEIEKKWEAEDNEDLRSFISLKFASNAKVIDGKRFAVLTWERFKDVALDLINRGKEKRKEQETEEYSPLCNTIKDKIQEYIANNFITDTVVKTDVKSIVKAMEEGVRLGEKEQKPAEWSEEDEKMLCEITQNVNAYDAYTGTIFQQLEYHDKKMNWLKSLSPRHITYALDAPLGYDKDMNPIYPPINHWKPSEWQMAVLRAVLNDNDNMASESANIALESLYNDLKKLT